MSAETAPESEDTAPSSRPAKVTARGGEAPAPTGPAPARRDIRGALRRHRWLVGPALLVLAVVVVRAFFVTPFGIPSRSMEQTLLVGDRILVDRTTTPDEVRRGDIIVFDAAEAFNLRAPERGLVQTLVDSVESIFGKGQPTDYVKRVIGLPGDRVRCCTPDGRLEVNRVAVTETYIPPGQPASAMSFDVIVPPGRFWVMGDNRGLSSDSRAHLGDPGGGTVPGEDIIGKVWVRYWPLDRLGPIEQGQIASVPRNGE